MPVVGSSRPERGGKNKCVWVMTRGGVKVLLQPSSSLERKGVAPCSSCSVHHGSFQDTAGQGPSRIGAIIDRVASESNLHPLSSSCQNLPTFVECDFIVDDGGMCQSPPVCIPLWGVHEAWISATN
jgi:hypothetical protein